MKKNDFIKRYGEEAYQRQLDKKKQYRETHKEEIAEYNKQWREQNPQYDKQYYQSHKEEIKHYQSNTPMGRANRLLYSYKRNDRKYNRGECTLTSDWIVNNIFNSKCIYCGESDWKLLGCDRIDNSKAHTEDNVVCCCGKCNVERGLKEFDEFVNEC